MTPEQEFKYAFAEAWLRNPKNAYAAALKVTRNNVFTSLQLADKLVWDDEVLRFKQELIEKHGEEYFLPSKVDMIRDVLDRASASLFDDTYVKLMKLAADMRGFIEKPGLTINNNTQTNNRIMVVPMGKLTDSGAIDSDHWEQVAIAQQKSLTQ